MVLLSIPLFLVHRVSPPLVTSNQLPSSILIWLSFPFPLKFGIFILKTLIGLRHKLFQDFFFVCSAFLLLFSFRTFEKFFSCSRTEISRGLTLYWNKNDSMQCSTSLFILFAFFTSSQLNSFVSIELLEYLESIFMKAWSSPWGKLLRCAKACPSGFYKIQKHFRRLPHETDFVLGSYLPVLKNPASTPKLVVFFIKLDLT